MDALNTGEIKFLRIQRWLDRLANFSYEVIYKKGKDIPYVDCFSRNSENKPDDKTCKIENIENETKDMEQKIKLLHTELIHRGRKSMEYEAKRRGYESKDLNKIIAEVVKNVGFVKCTIQRK